MGQVSSEPPGPREARPEDKLRERDGGGVFGGLCIAPSVSQRFRAARHLPYSLSRTGEEEAVGRLKECERLCGRGG